MSRRAIVNVALGSWFPKGQARLRRSLQKVGFGGDFLTWTDDLPPNTPEPHQTQTYKASALRFALEQGYDSVFWLDASFWAVRPVEPMFEHVERHGYAFWSNDHWSIGQWMTDETVAILSYTREQLLEIPCTWGGIIGLDLRAELARDFLERYCTYAAHGIFGQPTDRRLPGSSDSRVLGQRYSQNASSLVVNELGLSVLPYKPWRFMALLSEEALVDENVCVVAHGM